MTMKMKIPGIDKEESNRDGEDWDWDLRLEKFDNGIDKEMCLGQHMNYRVEGKPVPKTMEFEIRLRLLPFFPLGEP